MFFFFIIERWSANLQVLICTPYGVCVSACVFVCVCVHAFVHACLPAPVRVCVYTCVCALFAGGPVCDYRNRCIPVYLITASTVELQAKSITAGSCSTAAIQPAGSEYS